MVPELGAVAQLTVNSEHMAAVHVDQSPVQVCLTWISIYRAFVGVMEKVNPGYTTTKLEFGMVVQFVLSVEILIELLFQVLAALPVATELFHAQLISLIHFSSPRSKVSVSVYKT